MQHQLKGSLLFFMLPALWSALHLALLGFGQLAMDDRRWNGTEVVVVEEQQPNLFVCPNATPVVGIHSHWMYPDRRWEFQCALPFEDLHFQWGGWHDDFNMLRQVFTFSECPPNTFVSGVATQFFDEYNDRVWQFFCNNLPPDHYTLECIWSGVVNRPQENFSLSLLGSLKVITAVKSTFHAGKEDREWNFLLCTFGVVDCGPPSLSNGNVTLLGPPIYRNLALFSCLPGYYLEGPRNATCGRNGTWTDLPVCSACTAIRHCAESVCTSPEDTICLRCNSIHSNGLPLVLADNQKKCRVPPVIQPGLEAVGFIPGDDVILYCDARGIPLPRVVWYRAREQGLLETSNRVYQLDNNSLVILNASDSDVGLYVCVATNIVGQDSTNITLYNERPRPVEPPTILHWRQIYSFHSYSTAWVHCKTTGYPPPSITWSRTQDEEITAVPDPHTSSTRIQLLPNGTLVFCPVLVEDLGVYTCSAHNIGGFRAEQTVLFVYNPPNPSGSTPVDPPNPVHAGIVASGGISPPLISHWQLLHFVGFGRTLELTCEATGERNSLKLIVRKNLKSMFLCPSLPRLSCACHTLVEGGWEWRGGRSPSVLHQRLSHHCQCELGGWGTVPLCGVQRSGSDDKRNHCRRSSWSHSYLYTLPHNSTLLSHPPPFICQPPHCLRTIAATTPADSTCASTRVTVCHKPSSFIVFTPKFVPCSYPNIFHQYSSTVVCVVFESTFPLHVYMASQVDANFHCPLCNYYPS